MTISQKLDEVFEGSKTLHIMRGVSGAGKSTYIKQNIPDPKVIHSTDDVVEHDVAPKLTGKTGMEAYKAYFQHMQNTKDFGLHHKSHQMNLDNAKRSMDQGEENVVIDNTNLEPWEAKRYAAYGLEKGYNVSVHNVDPGNVSAEELAARNLHGVPLEVIQKMLNKFKRNPEMTVDEIMAAKDK